MNRLLGRLGVRDREHVTVARDFSIYSTVNIVSLALLLGTALMLRRWLGPYLAGVWTGLELLPTYVATYAHAGALNAAERDLPYLLGARRDDDFDRVKDTLFWFVHAIGVGLAAVVAAVALARRGRESREAFVGLLLYAPVVWAQLAATFYLVLYRARQRFVALSARQGTVNVVKAGLLLVAAYGWGLYGVLAAEAIASLLIVAVLHAGAHETFSPTFEPTRLRPLMIEGLPMVVGAVTFEALKGGADQTVILATLGAAPLGVYSLTSLFCQAMFYIPNVLAMVMFPRFQARYAAAQGDVRALGMFVEVPLRVFGDALLAATAVLLVALPPAIRAWFPQYAGTIAPLRVMLVGTYFLCLAPPAGQLLLTIHKQVPALLVAVPTTALAFAAAYVGSRYGLIGVAAGVASACFVEFAAINAYALSHLLDRASIAARLGVVTARAAAVVLAVGGIVRFVPRGPRPFADVGGWQLVAVAALALPLLLRAQRYVAARQPADSVDNAAAGH